MNFRCHHKELRGLLVLALCIALASCSPLVRLPPPGLTEAATLTVFCDGFHSGIVVAKDPFDQVLGLQADDVEGSWPLRAIHFGEDAWTRGLDNSWIHAVRLAFVPGDGVVVVGCTRRDLLDIPGLNPDRLRSWTFPISASASVALHQHLIGVWLTTAREQRPPAEPVLIVPSQNMWHVFHNCHDFTADMLRSSGLSLKGHWLYLAGDLIDDLDQAQAELTAAGITVIGPDPAGLPHQP